MIILASQSPRRQELMKYITQDFEVKVSEVDETLPKKMSPSQAVMYLSQIKAEPFRNDEDIVIGADTVVALGSSIIRTGGIPAMAIPILTLFFIPPDSLLTCLVKYSCTPSRCRNPCSNSCFIYFQSGNLTRS